MNNLCSTLIWLLTPPLFILSDGSTVMEFCFLANLSKPRISTLRNGIKFWFHLMQLQECQKFVFSTLLWSLLFVWEREMGLWQQEPCWQLWYLWQVCVACQLQEIDWETLLDPTQNDGSLSLVQRQILQETKGQDMNGRQVHNTLGNNLSQSK